MHGTQQGDVYEKCMIDRGMPVFRVTSINWIFQGYQKTNTIGHTEPEQRWNDLKACGVKNYSDGRLDLSVAYSNMTTQQVIARRNEIWACTEAKGYVIYGALKCKENSKI